MDSLIGASFIASFLAGVAALFAPCCITVLLPTYFASIFKQKIKIFFMTFVFFLGLLIVFLPLGLGASILSQFFSQNHNTVFSVGGIFLIFMGILLLSGKSFSLPFTVHPQLKNYDIFSVFILGIFSGIATTCCAPVLAGVLTLSVLPGSFIFGAIYSLSYVLGMVVPLFIVAFFIDKTNLTEKFFLFRKRVSYSFFSEKIYLPLSNLFSGLMFFILGVATLYLARTNKLTSHSNYQLTINIYLAKFTKFVQVLFSPIPELIWGLIFIGLFLLILKLALKQIMVRR